MTSFLSEWWRGDRAPKADVGSAGDERSLSLVDELRDTVSALSAYARGEPPAAGASAATSAANSATSAASPAAVDLAAVRAPDASDAPPPLEWRLFSVSRLCKGVAHCAFASLALSRCVRLCRMVCVTWCVVRRALRRAERRRRRCRFLRKQLAHDSGDARVRVSAASPFCFEFYCSMSVSFRVSTHVSMLAVALACPFGLVCLLRTVSRSPRAAVAVLLTGLLFVIVRAMFVCLFACLLCAMQRARPTMCQL